MIKLKKLYWDDGGFWYTVLINNKYYGYIKGIRYVASFPIPSELEGLETKLNLIAELLQPPSINENGLF